MLRNRAREQAADFADQPLAHARRTLTATSFVRTATINLRSVPSLETLGNVQEVFAMTSQFLRLMLLSSVLLAAPSFAQTKRKLFIPGQHAIVFDDRLSALREQPDVKAPLKQRLSRGRLVGIVGTAKGKSGSPFVRVAISRNVRGWLLTAAIARLGSAADGEKILAAIAESKDDLVKARLARLCADELRSATIAPKALLALGQAAEHAAEKLSRDADRRLGDDLPEGGLSKRDFVLSFNGLDRFNRAGVTFEYDETRDRIVYDGAAYKELLRRYPRSAETEPARARLAQLEQPLKP